MPNQIDVLQFGKGRVYLMNLQTRFPRKREQRFSRGNFVLPLRVVFPRIKSKFFQNSDFKIQGQSQFCGRFRHTCPRQIEGVEFIYDGHEHKNFPPHPCKVGECNDHSIFHQAESFIPISPDSDIFHVSSL